MDRADPNRARDRHSNHLDDYVRLYRKRARQSGSFEYSSGNSKTHGWDHRVRAAELRLRGSADVSPQAARRFAPRRQRRGSHEDVRGIAPDVEQLYSQSAGFVGARMDQTVADRAAIQR